MREFFKGWRRKAGCVTLAVALTFMGMWLRSRVVLDWVWVSFPNGVHVLGSSNSNIGWQRGQESYGESFGFASLPFVSSHDDPSTRWHFQWAGFKSGEDATSMSHYWFIPYWSIVLPLTALAAWLLITKPGLAKTREST